jgi:hypothetical protein
MLGDIIADSRVTSPGIRNRSERRHVEAEYHIDAPTSIRVHEIGRTLFAPVEIVT